VVTYLRARSPNFANVFLQRLMNLRQLDGLLWVVMPPTLAPQDWPILRLKRLD
jgi:hypothetical protein